MGSPIFELCDQHVTRLAALDPVMATYAGIREHGGRGTDYSPDGVNARADLSRDTLHRLAIAEAEADAEAEAGADTPDADRLAALHLRERLEAQLGIFDAEEWKRDLAAHFGRVQ